MQSKDIEPGAEYAYQRTAYGRIWRVRAVEATTMPGATLRSKTRPGWKVEFLDDAPGFTKGITISATSRQILMPWAEHERQEAERKAERERARLVYEASKEKARKDLADLHEFAKRYGLDLEGSYSNPQQIVRFSPGRLLTLLKKVADQVTEEMY